MAVTTTQFTSSLIRQLRAAFPKLHFILDPVCRWSPDSRTVYYREITSDDDAFNLLHEVAHALLGHTSFSSDIELIQKEMQAWMYAVDHLGPRFSVAIPREFAETEIDTYREWIHKRSTCPECGQNGLQIKTETYKCLNCRSQWRVNDARQCGLKRYKM